MNPNRNIHSVSFEVDFVAGSLIDEIVLRAEHELGHKVNRLGLTMDITACHANGTPLRLKELADAPKADFLHDVLGIQRFIDRTTGKLTDCFCPRYAAPQPKEIA